MKNYVVFDAYYKNKPGVWFYCPSVGEFVAGEPSTGFGTVRYPEGSVYTGDIYYDGKNFIKHGFGTQNFTYSKLGELRSDIGLRKFKFVGEYDKDHEWIFGNGVLYYTDENLKPKAFVKGNFLGLALVGPYKGEFDENSLIEGFTPDMEFCGDEDVNVQLKINRKKRVSEKYSAIDVLLIGDSYFDLGDAEEFAGKNVFKNSLPDGFCNLGVNGSTFLDWNGWIDQFKTLPKPNKIVINLGYNDCHTGRSLQSVYDEYLKFLKTLKEYFGDAKIYLIKAVHSPAYPDRKTFEEDWNDLISSSSDALGITLIDWNDDIVSAGENCFANDKVHPNEYGYGLFTNIILKAVK